MAIDNFSKWIYHKFLASTDVEQVISFLDDIFKLEGVPKILCSDNGTQFTSKRMKDYLKNKGIRAEYSPLYFPAANGQVERANRFIKDGIQLAIANSMNVKNFIKERLWVYHNTPHNPTVQTPFVLARGRRARLEELFLHNNTRINKEEMKELKDRQGDI